MEIGFDITQLHEDIYILLSEMKRDDPTLRYSYRKSNHAGRLEDGYWFYGNDNYLAISFWTGMDWKNRTPNIVFIIGSDGECYLEVNVSDSSTKRSFVDTFMVDKLNLNENGRKYFKHYEIPDLSTTDTFVEFIKTDKVIIDRLIKEYQFFFDNEKEEDKIGLISKEEFKKRQANVTIYRKKKLATEKESEDNSWNLKNPSKIKRIKIEKFGFIESIEINLDINNEWVFITGPNGTGKTLLLRAIGAVLGNKILSKRDCKGRSSLEFYAEVDLVFNENTQLFYRSGNLNVGEITKPLVQGLAMYGPYRLDLIDEKISAISFNKKLNKRDSFLSLFSEGEKLLSIDKQFSIWRKENPNKFEKLKYYIRSVLTDVVPELVNIEFDKDHRGHKKNLYVFQRDENPIQKLEWEDLSSGTKNIFALLGDILIRLYNYQKAVIDPSEFTGVVIIDEIDLHLHPQAQKDLVQNLSKTFPRVQFIVSTHSPIPLLGAPKNSAFLTVYKVDDEIMVKKLELDISNLLPNTILTSPVFGMDELRSSTNSNIKNLNIDDHFDEKLFYDIVRKKINELTNNPGWENKIDKSK